MPLNIPGLLVPFHLVINPRLIIPGLVVKDIRQLDFLALKKAGYRGAVFDKDNCLTLPHKDTLVPELQDAWKECCATFGESNILIVSNSAGTSHLDAGGIQAESVTYHLSVPVLRHTSMKPAYSCIASIRAYFSSLRTPIRDEELIVVGDRIFTDVVLANRMAARKRPQYAENDGDDLTAAFKPIEGPLAVWTNGIWQKESMILRWLEKRLVDGVQRWTAKSNRVNSEGNKNEMSRLFVKDKLTAVEPIALPNLWSKLLRRK